MELKEIVTFLRHYYQQYTEIKQKQQKTALYDANAFNPLRFLRTDEMGLSAILAFLLDPNETHGQQDLFLNSFLKYSHLATFLAYDRVDVVTEQSTAENRRHDIFIQGYLNNEIKWIISIENKLRGAVDQPKQIQDYLKDIGNRVKENYCLIYLPNYDKDPDESSLSKEEREKLSKENKFKIITPTDLIQWLDQTPIIAPRMQQFCDDIKQFLQQEFLAMTKESNQLIEQIIQSEQDIKMAILLGELQDLLKIELMKKLQKQLQGLFSDVYRINQFLHFEDAEKGKSKYFSIVEIKSNTTKYSVRMEFDRSNYQNLFYGFYKRFKLENENEFYKTNKTIFDEITDKNSNEWWFCWKYADTSILIWNKEVWSKIPSGEIAQKIYDMLLPLVNKMIEIDNQLKE
ncbi:PD-(D/E)XK nuclease family protein [Lonepinella sp. BR2357]|uniref:PDDEXK-like family protein n=1 Tax=Lonepinella sp. BR2357 TaxID=3434549 RepID=UPI003F6DA7C4